MTRIEATSIPESTARTNRSTSTVVLPVPAPAETKTTPGAAIAASCSGVGGRSIVALIGRSAVDERGGGRGEPEGARVGVGLWKKGARGGNTVSPSLRGGASRRRAT